MEYNKALEIANELVEKLRPVCERVEIAGSIRRKKPEVKDIEICVIAKTIEVSDGDLFEPKLTKVPTAHFASVVNNLGIVMKGNFNGRYMQIILPFSPDRIVLDLFIPAEGEWGKTYAIRTGSAEYSGKVLASGWRKIGWCGSDVGLRKMEDCEKIDLPDGKYKWKCVNPVASLPPIFPEEIDFFNWINVPYVEPENRNI